MAAKQKPGLSDHCHIFGRDTASVGKEREDAWRGGVCPDFSISLIMKGAGKGLKVVREGKVAKTEIWGEAEMDSALGDHPGTAIPQGFKLKVGGRTFLIKPNATKHMAERAQANASLGAYAGRVEFPISSLAAALKQAEARGDLAPLLTRKISRLGTSAQPFRVDE